jgi:hypothetical protein
MENAENSKEVIVKKPKRRVWKIALWVIVGLVVLLILGVVVGVPAYVSSGSCREMILSKANAAGVGVVDFSKLTMSWGKGISVSKISYKDKANILSVAVNSFSTKPKYGALLTGSIALGETVIDEPRVEIDIKKLKQKAEEGKTRAGSPRHEQKTGTAGAGLPIGQIDLVVRNGDVRITGGAKAVEVSQINTTVNLRPEGEKSSFDIGAKMVESNKPGSPESTLTAKGDVTPGKGWDMKKTSADITVEVNNLQLSQLESLLAIAGVDVTAKGELSANVKAAIKNGMVENVDADVEGKGLEITAPQLKGDTIKTSVLEVKAQAGQEDNLINVKTMTVRTDWLKVDASGAAPTSLATLEDFLKPDSKGALKASMECDIPAIAAQLPNTMGLKEGTKLTGGKVVGNVATLTEAGSTSSPQAGVKKLSGKVSVEGLAGMVDGKPVSLPEPIRAEALITIEGKEIKFEKAGVTSAFANMSCTGTTGAFSYTAETDLAKLSSELGQFVDISQYKLSGQAASKGQITNSKSTTMIVSQTNITNLKASPTPDITINEPNDSINITAAIDKEKQVLLVKQLAANTSLGQYSVKDGRIPMGKDSKEPMQLTASARGVDLSKLQPYLVMAKAISKDVQLGGITESDVTLSAQGGVYKITTDSTKITNLLVKAPGKQAFTQSQVTLGLDAELNPAASVWTIKADISSPDIKIKANIKQDVENKNSNLQGNAQLDYDWKAISGMLSAFMPAGLTIEGKRKDTISFSSKYPAKDTNAMLANLDAQAKVGFDKASYMGLNIGATNVEAKADKGLLTLTPFTTTVNNGQLNFGGSVDFKKKPAVFRTPGPMQIVKDVQINDVVANMLLAKVNPIFAGANKTSGFANFDCDKMAVPIIGGKPEDADVAGTISLTQVRMQTGLLAAILAATGSTGDLITLHPTPFTVSGGFVRYSNMEFDLGQMPIYFSGIVPVDPNRKIENFSVVMPISITGKVARAGGGTGGGTTVVIKGTPNKPELDIGKTVIQTGLQQGLEMLMESQKKK